ncbi:DUF4097 family beta strand repeat-containing protein [Cellulomonas fimi]|uniref:DUF4097 domain-containing protein n=1 Tax=Cellulomonas fimi (strain ATCC 484 / DSM 20113 / JCM 1341 / CCUG 24087 / LMG 16345 / NBRC 15513 / NCIMB 8980 / NCTC 7547 / NRS-133) TaxID=590998 RepID=F4H6E6_CELFA|nr:DUF4097 family beta strand repeat-containing protein [Cellulomonas fimi]AEE45579.1 hypothetical protein Celf_1444 [Cellulomonas fimi ATCC 484]NNH05911.1 DUF4097 family beta strand repeat protein [Cellulomonas fimi]VEH29934.1 Uncharacterised protein [Cellulomonas fimi]
MPTYSTPEAIDLAVHVPVGDLRVVASDRTDTVVTLAPSNPAKDGDHRAVEETKVALDGRRLTVLGPRPRLSWIGPGPSESVDVTVELPAGSRLTAELSVGTVHTVGRLGATRAKSSAVHLGTTGDLWVRAMHGEVEVEHVEGTAEITADHGRVRLGTVDGDAVVKASHGSVHVEESRGDLEAKLSYGDLDIERALGSVGAKTAYGSIRLGEVSSGSIQVESGYGQVSVGVRPGVAAWLDLSSKDGRVRNQLDGERTPDEGELTVAVRARTRSGDITVQHAR